MTKIERISVALPKDMLKLVEDAVKAGDYLTTSEVIFAALYEWKAKREARERSRAELRRLYQEGLDSGGWHPLDTEAIKRKGRRMLAKVKET